MSPSLVTIIFLFYVLKNLLGSWKTTLAAGWGRLLEARRRRLHLKRRRLGVRGPEARSGAGQRGAASPLRGTGAQQRRLELHGPLQCRPARHPAEGPETRRRRGSKDCPGSNSSATAPKQYISYLQLCSNVLQNKLSRRQQKYIVNVYKTVQVCGYTL